MFKWEYVHSNNDLKDDETKHGPDYTARAKVPGGWLVYTYDDRYGGSLSSTVTFIPDPKHAWEVE